MHRCQRSTDGVDPGIQFGLGTLYFIPILPCPPILLPFSLPKHVVQIIKREEKMALLFIHAFTTFQLLPWLEVINQNVWFGLGRHLAPVPPCRPAPKQTHDINIPTPKSKTYNNQCCEELRHQKTNAQTKSLSQRKIQNLHKQTKVNKLP